MKITNDMLKAAIEKAVEAGLLPKYARRVESVAEREVMKVVLQAALDARGLAAEGFEPKASKTEERLVIRASQ